MNTKLFTALLTLLLPLSRVGHADQARFLPHGQDSLEEFSRLITTAKSSINIATFIFDPCSASTQLLMRQLAVQAKKGVHVRMLLDSFQLDSSYKQNLINFAAASKIELRLYADSITDDINARMHIKFMTVDDQAVIAGGRNWSDEYWALSSRLNYSDRDLSVTGAIGAQAAAYFEELWAAEKTSTPSPDSYSFKSWNQACGRDENLAKRVTQVQALLNQDALASWSKVPVRNCSHTMFRSDNPDFRDSQYGLDASDMNALRLSHKRATKHMLSFMSGARKSLALENYAYMPINLLEGAFTNLRQRHVPVSVISNADMEDGPDFFKEAEVYAIETITAQDSRGSERVTLVSSKGALSDANRLTPAGALFYLHGKTAVRDSKDVLVGSFNLDERSAAINLESMIIVSNCPELAADVHQAMLDVYQVVQSDEAAHRIPAKAPPSDFAKFFEQLTLSEF